MTLSEAAKILGIPVTANADELRKAYRKLIKLWHPDKHPNDPKAKEVTQKINEAHAVFQKHLERAGNSNSGSRPGTSSGSGRSGGSSNTNSGVDRDDHRPRNERRDATMEKIIQDLWNKYQVADKKYREYGTELRKAYEEKVRQQDILDSVRKMYNASPTIENLKKLNDAAMVYNRALMNHNKAMFKLQTLKFERDACKRTYDLKVLEYNTYKQTWRR